MTGILAECPAHFKMGSDLKLTEMNYSFCDSSESLLVRQPKNKFKISTTRLRTIALIRCINGSHFFSFANLRFSFVWNLSGHPVDIPFMVLLSQTLLPHVLFLKGNEVQQKQCKPKCIYNVYTFRAIPLPQLSLDLILLRKIENHSLPVTILNKIGNVQR